METAVFSQPKVDKLINNDARILTALLLSTPSLRARFFANPTTEVGRNLPPAKSWNYSRPDWAWLPWYWPGSPVRYRQERKRLARAILIDIERQINDLKLKASVNADSIFEEYFAPIITVSQRTFSTVYVLSIAAFVAGLSLIGVGSYVGIVSPPGANSTVVASIFGGSGAISALGSVYTVATSGISDSMKDLARIRLVMTSFATQLGQLRAIIEKDLSPDDLKTAAAVADTVNGYIQDEMTAALTGLPLVTNGAVK
ncbi:MAG: hypothetical protein ACYDB2_12125 [Acidimicrobiales bacterium]